MDPAVKPHRCPTLDEAFGCEECQAQVRAANRARAEKEIARIAESKPAKQLTVLEEAGLLVNDGGDRNDSYDHPYANFSKIAAGWSVLVGVEISPRKVALMMVWLKCVRDSHKPKRDNLVDGAGYFRCAERLDEWPLKAEKDQ